VLIAEDEWTLAVEAELLVAQCGCAVVGPTGTVSTALNLVGHSALDGAVLDINLRGELVWPVADVLEERGVPFLFLTANTQAVVPQRFAHHPLVPKPASLALIRKALAEIGTICE
jgi:CheY-like chemotaxis protein